MVHTVVAALVVSAAAAAQVPTAPPDAPSANPGATTPSPTSTPPVAQRSDQDIQREIDAKVEAAKKELREEMRAQAATQSALNTGWDSEVASERRKLELFVPNGYFRVRPELFHKFDLNQPAYNGFYLYPRPDASTPAATGATGSTSTQPTGGHTIAGTNMRFRFEPTLNVSEEVRIHAQVDLFDNIVLGSTPDYAYSRQDRIDIGLLSEGQAPPIANLNSATNSIVAKRVYGEVATPVGIARFGRMGSQWGLGLVHNDGNCLDCDHGETVDRLQFVAEPLPGYFIIPMLDFDVEGLVSQRTLDPGQPVDVTTADDSHSFIVVLAHKDSDQQAKAKLDAGGSVINYGLHFTYRNQKFEYAQNGQPFTQPDTFANPNPSLNRISRHGYLYLPDLWLKFERKRFRIEAEFASYLGKVEVPLPVNGTPTQVTIAQFGGALQSEVRFFDGALKIGLELGYASGDKAPGLGNRPGRINPTIPRDAAGRPTEVGARSKDIEGAQYICNALGCSDNAIRNFRFNRDYRIDLILWREILDGVTDAVYAKPSASYNILDGFQVWFSPVYSRTIYKESSPSGNAASLGIELDAGLRYQTEDGFFAWLSYGVLFPLDGLKNTVVQQPNTGDPAQAIRAALGIRF